MARYVTTVATPLSPDEAFDFMADVTRFAEWDPGVTQAVRVPGTPDGTGAAFDLTVKAGATSVMRYVVTTWEPPRRFVMEASTSTLTSVDVIEVVPDGTGARVTYDATLTLRGVLGVFDPALRIAFRVIGDRAAAGLRRALGGHG